MKKIFLFTALLPLALFAQKKPVAKKPAVKKTATVKKSAATEEDAVVKPADGYVIYGTMKGLPDATPIYFYDEQTGGLNEQGRVIKEKFKFTGKVQEPELKQVYFGTSYQPLQLFVDNSAIKIEGEVTNIVKSVISGSPTHKLFGDLVNQINPLQQILTNEGEVYDTATRSQLKSVLTDFIQKNNTSYVAPVALVILNNTASDNEALIENLYTSLPANLRYTPYGNYIGQRIQDAKKIPLGTVLPDFSQEDSTGKPVSLSSFRGKYLLVDFWASWCRPCRQENPNVVAAYNKFNSKNFTILGVSFDQTKPAWINAIAMDGLTWNHVSDLKGWGNAVGQQFGIQSIPQNLLIGPDGKVIGKNLRGKDLVRKLNALLN